jgi:hypothetical protein
MTDNGGWNPMPNNTARPARKQVPRARGEELWRLSHGEKIAPCELRDDTNVGAGFEVLIRHDDEPIIGRRCLNEAEARYYVETFRQDYARSGWAETT